VTQAGEDKSIKALLIAAVKQGFEPWVDFKAYNALAKREHRSQFG
jgi:hypothetical protein